MSQDTELMQRILEVSTDVAHRVGSLSNKLEDLSISDARKSERLISLEGSIRELRESNVASHELDKTLSTLSSGFTSMRDTLERYIERQEEHQQAIMEASNVSVRLSESIHQIGQRTITQAEELKEVQKSVVELSKEISDLNTEKKATIRLAAWGCSVVLTILLLCGGWFASMVVADHDILIQLGERLTSHLGDLHDTAGK
jgi:chromosome segregation ATPase